MRYHEVMVHSLAWNRRKHYGNPPAWQRPHNAAYLRWPTLPTTAFLASGESLTNPLGQGSTPGVAHGPYGGSNTSCSARWPHPSAPERTWVLYPHTPPAGPADFDTQRTRLSVHSWWGSPVDGWLV